MEKDLRCSLPVPKTDIQNGRVLIETIVGWQNAIRPTYNSIIIVMGAQPGHWQQKKHKKEKERKGKRQQNSVHVSM